MRPFDGGPGRKVEVCDRKYTDKRTDWIVFRYLCINASPMIRLASTHQDEWNGFLEWFVKNPIRVDKEHYFHRNLFE